MLCITVRDARPRTRCTVIYLGHANYRPVRTPLCALSYILVVSFLYMCFCVAVATLPDGALRICVFCVFCACTAAMPNFMSLFAIRTIFGKISAMLR